ncbi:arylesterase [Pseudoalteromonas porphyrae]|uniref:Arylesterase n=2 Tax=Pseudoalteromonas TaxID=53246 RepID=A0A0N1EEA3_9GAMM|nr:MULTISPECIES: arylesterase [Pseudoalteromonas]KPH58302.1 arylesterase [Pseudoalteromonas porphyrae]KPH95133.1 arylesterase [Pseudoalteromonas porphyrae]NMR27989.1 arylesterase [Pseudoalteromonas sp. NEC-BIFX-2020_015]NNG44887.1 arylesterase [Pseudoalteromonas sp. NEC-BIFX-2020_002]
MMHSILRLIFVFLIVIKPLTAAADNTILILGDSLSAAYGLKQEQGWVKLLQDKYDKEQLNIQLINASISGETTGGALRRLDSLLNEFQPSHVLIELGGNDGLRGFPIKRLEQNLTQLVNLSKQADANIAIMEIHIPPNYGPRYTSQFTGSFEKVATATDSHLMDFFVLNVAGDPTLMQNDNIHPNKTAQPILRDIMYKSIKMWLEK